MYIYFIYKADRSLISLCRVKQSYKFTYHNAIYQIFTRILLAD